VAACRANGPIRRDNLDRAQVVAGEAVGTHQDTQTTTEREAGDAGGRHLAAGGGEAKDLGLAIELSPGDATLCPHPARSGVDLHSSHGGQVDDQSVVAYRATCHLVPPATDAYARVALARDPHCLNDVRGVSAPGDGGRMTVDQPVPHPSCPVIAGVESVDDLTLQGSAKLGNLGLFHSDRVPIRRVGHPPPRKGRPRSEPYWTGAHEVRTPPRNFTGHWQ
jgi:hypothetical protein